VLQAATLSHLKKWPDKVAVINRGPELLKPQINPEIQQVVYDALLKEKQIKASYKPKNKHEISEYTIHPLAIVNKHSVIYLVCTLWNYHNIKQLALHRFESAELQDANSNTPHDFILSDYVKEDHQFAYPISPNLIQLKVLFDAQAGEHLFETPLTENQTLTAQDDGKLLLEVEISDTQELRWWLSGFGSTVEVVGPVGLREYFQHESESMVKFYKNKLDLA